MYTYYPPIENSTYSPKVVIGETVIFESEAVVVTLNEVVVFGEDSTDDASVVVLVDAVDGCCSVV